MKTCQSGEYFISMTTAAKCSRSLGWPNMVCEALEQLVPQIAALAPGCQPRQLVPNSRSEALVNDVVGPITDHAGAN